MDLYFADRQYNVIGVASTNHHNPLRVANEIEDNSTDAATTALNGTLYFDHDHLAKAREMTQTSNYIMYHDDQGEDQFSTILESHLNTMAGTVTFTGDSAGNDLRNETIAEYTATSAMTFAQYFNLFTSDSGWVLATDETNGAKRTLVFDSEEAVYDRLLSLATQFGMELDFSFTIHGTDPVKRYVNVVKSEGRDNGVTLRVGRELNSITIDSDMYDLRTSIKAIGGTPDGKDKPITLKGYKWTDSAGRYVLGSDGVLRDTEAVKTYSRLRSNDNPAPTSSHLQRVTTYEAVTQASLLQSALSDLKKYNHPAVNYTLDVANLPDNLHKGDTVHLEDEEAELYLTGTVLDVQKCWSEGSTQITVGDYKIEPNQVSKELKDIAGTLKTLAATKQSYPWTMYADDDQGTGMTAIPAGKSYLSIVWGSTSTPSSDPADYAGHWSLIGGKNGENGAAGPAGADGKTPHVWTAYAKDLQGTGFSTSDATGASYIGQAVTYDDATQPTDYTKYNWMLVRGEQGVKGDPGATGAQGKDGSSSYLHTAYAQSADGTLGFNLSSANAATYLGTLVDDTKADSTDPSKYTWVKIQGDPGEPGADGQPGAKGADGKTSYIHIAWANSADGTDGFTIIKDTRVNLFDLNTWWQDSNDEGANTSLDIKGAPDTVYTVSTNYPAPSDASSPDIWADAKATAGTTAIYTGHPHTITTGDDGVVTVTAKNSTAVADISAGKTYVQVELGSTATSEIPVSTNYNYQGTCVDFNQDSPTDPSAYGWTESAYKISEDLKDYTDRTLSAQIPVPSSGASLPTNPVAGQQFWVTTKGSSALYQYDGTTWQPIKLDASSLDATTFTGMTFNGVTFNGSQFVSNYNYTHDGGTDGADDGLYIGNTTMSGKGISLEGTVKGTDGVTHADQYAFGPDGFAMNSFKGTSITSNVDDLNGYTWVVPGAMSLMVNKGSAGFVGGNFTAEMLYKMQNVGNQLWSGSWGMAGTTTMTLSKKISDCLNGIVLLWGTGKTNEPAASDFTLTFIPKWFPASHSGRGMDCFVGNAGKNTVGIKYVYVTDTTIKGYSNNTNNLAAEKTIQGVYEY